MILIIAHGVLKLDEAIKGKIWCHYFARTPIFSGYDEKYHAWKIENYVPDSIMDAIHHSRLVSREAKARNRMKKAEKRLETLYEIEDKISYANVFQGLINLYNGDSWEEPIIERGRPRPTALIDTILSVPATLLSSPFWGFMLLRKANDAMQEAIQSKRGVKKEKETIKIFEQAISTSEVITIARQNNESVVTLKGKDITYRISFEYVPVDSIENVASFEYPIFRNNKPYKYTLSLFYDDILNSDNSQCFTDGVNKKIATISSIGGFRHVWEKITQANLIGFARDAINGRNL